MELVTQQPQKQRNIHHAFSLIELMVTMSIAAILIGLTAMSLTGGNASLQLLGAADATSAIFAQTRQLSASTNHTHELRLYRWEENAENRFGFFIHRVDSDGTATFTGESYIADSSTQLSTDLSSVFSDDALIEQPGNPPTKGSAISKARFVRIEIHPSGMTNLNAARADGEACYLSLTTRSEIERSGALHNFVMLVIDPSNASVKVLRPS